MTSPHESHISLFHMLKTTICDLDLPSDVKEANQLLSEKQPDLVSISSSPAKEFQMMMISWLFRSNVQSFSGSNIHRDAENQQSKIVSFEYQLYSENDFDFIKLSPVLNEIFQLIEIRKNIIKKSKNQSYLQLLEKLKLSPLDLNFS